MCKTTLEITQTQVLFFALFVNTINVKFCFTITSTASLPLGNQLEKGCVEVV